MTTTTSKPDAFQMPPPSPEHAATQRVADRLVALCAAGKHDEAMRTLYADNCRHVEAMDCPGTPYTRIIEGKKSLLEMCARWEKTTTVHSASVGKPMVNGDQFVVEMSMDCTNSEGPMAGQRMQMSEIALYTVRNDHITEAKFFYSTGG